MIPQITIKVFHIFFFFDKYKNEWKEYKFDDKKINKSNFYKNKKLFSLNNLDANEILVSKK